MKYSLKFVWYVLRIVIVAASAFAILIVAFFIAMDSANVYVIVTDGMKARATTVLMPGQEADISKYFSAGYMTKQTNDDRAKYANFVIADFDYNISVESLWCSPWKNKATVTVVESIPKIVTTGTADATDEKAEAQPPQWPRARYKITCIRENGAWRIDSADRVESLEPEPTASPEPSTYITASPAPSPAPSAGASMPQSTEAEATPSPAK